MGHINDELDHEISIAMCKKQEPRQDLKHTIHSKYNQPFMGARYELVRRFHTALANAVLHSSHWRIHLYTYDGNLSTDIPEKYARPIRKAIKVLSAYSDGFYKAEIDARFDGYDFEVTVSTTDRWSGHDSRLAQYSGVYRV